MRTVSENLAIVESLLMSAKPAEAERTLQAVIEDNPVRALLDHEEAIRWAVGKFLPKRQKRLTSLLDRRINQATQPVRSPHVPISDLNHAETPVLETRRTALRTELYEISENHIFQWNNYYKDLLDRWYLQALALEETHEPGAVARVVRDEFRTHAKGIFEKGFVYSRDTIGLSDSECWAKMASGLERFLSITLEVYLERLRLARRGSDAFCLWHSCSAMLAGIIEGSMLCSGSGLNGADVLSSRMSGWLHALGFMTSDDLARCIELVDVERIKQGLFESLAPVARALETLAPERAQSTLPVCVPLSSSYRDRPPLMELMIGAFDRRVGESGAMNVLVLLDETLDGMYGNVQGRHDLVVAADSPSLWNEKGQGADVKELVSTKARCIQDIVIDIQSAIDRFLGSSGRSGLAMPLTRNPARSFPLKNAFRTRFYFVQRPSVRLLVASLRATNGVHLWCSPRRSGKTTACFDIGSATGEAEVIVQTCAGTHLGPDDRVLMDEILRALDSNERLKPDFITRALAKCRATDVNPASRTILLLDEYERLFHELQQEAYRDGRVRARVVEPLLDQFVAFSESNLVVFVGQAPDAHYILMDLNQLSAYVQQDTFPLFEHQKRSQASEFSELVQKVVSQDYILEPEFCDALYRETGGHPYLTIMLLVELFEWFIAHKRSARDVMITEDSYLSFAEEHLSDNVLAGSAQYEFFRKTIAEAISDAGRHHTPWLYAVYSMLKSLAQHSPRGMILRRDEFLDFYKQLRIEEELGYNPEELLRSGVHSNVFSIDGLYVKPRIPILARLSRISLPRCL